MSEIGWSPTFEIIWYLRITYYFAGSLRTLISCLQNHLAYILDALKGDCVLSIRGKKKARFFLNVTIFQSAKYFKVKQVHKIQTSQF